VMHHGTLLFASEMKDISGALKVNPLKYQGRGTKSVPKRVTNISSHLKEPLTLEEFTNRIMNHILTTFPDARMYEFTETDLNTIQKIRDEKYATWEWNFGRSPEYNFKEGMRSEGGVIEVHLDVEKGIIKKAQITGDFFHIRDIAPIEEALVNLPHEYEAIKNILEQFDMKQYFKDITLEDLLDILF